MGGDDVALAALENLRHIPSGRVLLAFPHDLTEYAQARIPYLLVYSLGASWLTLLGFLHGRHLPRRLLEPWQRHWQPYLVLSAWMVIASITWLRLTPPASAFHDRLSLCLFVPGMLLLSFLLADASRMVTRRSTVLAPALSLVFLLASGLFPPAKPPINGFGMISETLAALDRLALTRSARVYAAPNRHLVLSFYANKPIQSLAPVRKSFLDSYGGEIVYIAYGFDHEFEAPDVPTLKRAAARRGQVITDEQARDWERRLRARIAGEDLRAHVSAVVPPLEDLPPFAQDAVGTARQRGRVAALEEAERHRPMPIYHCYDVTTGAAMW